MIIIIIIIIIIITCRRVREFTQETSWCESGLRSIFGPKNTHQTRWKVRTVGAGSTERAAGSESRNDPLSGTCCSSDR
jgi:hypothetical protein